MKRRIGSLCVALAMCLGLLPDITITADASDYIGDITVGGVITWALGTSSSMVSR